MNQDMSRRTAILGAGAVSAAAVMLGGNVPVVGAAPLMSGPIVPHLPLPVRLFDSRTSTILPNSRKFQSGDEVSIAVSALYDGSETEFAIAVFCNLTITETEGQGFLRIVPADYSDDPPVAEHSNINWWQSGLTMANSFVSPVGSEHSIVVSCHGGRAHVIIDGFAYVPSPPA